MIRTPKYIITLQLSCKVHIHTTTPTCLKYLVRLYIHGLVKLSLASFNVRIIYASMLKKALLFLGSTRMVFVTALVRFCIISLFTLVN